ncbi:hypothetical protein PMAYCL1PPCAC_00379, partial [Pristionchus mayeri]
LLMSSLFAILVLAAPLTVTHERVTFTHSEVLQDTDLDKDFKAPFKCENGCVAYSDSRSDEMFISDGDKDISYFGLMGPTAIESTGVQLLPWPNYILVYRGKTTPPRFVFYAVDKTAVDDTPVYVANNVTSYLDVYNQAPKQFTILRSSDVPPFFGFMGPFEATYPTIYATGYDAVRESECKPAYTARSAESAANSFITVDSPIVTVVNGAPTTNAKTGLKTNRFPLEENSSLVYISPGYVGCSYLQDQLYSSNNQIVSDSFSVDSQSLDITADLSIPTHSEAVKIAVNNEKLELYGVDPAKKHFEGVHFDVSIDWTRKTPTSSFAVQFDLGVKSEMTSSTKSNNPATSTTKSANQMTSTTMSTGIQTTSTSAGNISSFSSLVFVVWFAF